MLKTKNSLFERVAARCFAFADDHSGNDDAGGDDAGGGGGGDLPNGGGQVQEDAGHDFSTSFSTEAELKEVDEIMALDDNQTLSMDQIAKLMNANPPFPKDKKAEPKPAATATPAATPAATAAPAGTPDPNAPKLDPSVEALVKTLNTLASTPAPAASTPQDDKPNAPKPFYGGEERPIAVNEGLLRGLLGVEEGQPIPEAASKAVNTLVTGIMNRVMQDAASMQMAIAERIIGHIPNVVQSHGQMQSNSQKFYGAYPEFADKPALVPVINGITNSIAAEIQKTTGQPANKGDPEFQKRVGEAVHLYIEKQIGVKMPRGKAQPAVQAKPAQNAATKPNKGKFYTPGGARPPAATGGHLNGAGQSADDLRNFVL